MSWRVVIVTGTRAEYGLFHPLLERLDFDERFDVSVIVTGTHLSERFGMTVREIEAEGRRIAARVPLPLDEDSPVGVAHATATALEGIADALSAEKPDLVVLLGDRYETFAAAAAAALIRIPVAHLHGGELTEGAIDDSLRHAITKLSALHLTSTERYRQRVIQMGEEPRRVIATGALGVDNAVHTPLVPVAELERELGFAFEPPTALVTFHPVTLDASNGAEQLDALLGALDDRPQLRVLFTMPNADAGNSEMAARIRAWVDANEQRAAAFASLGRVRYLSALDACDLVMGNSSSGIIEAPSFRKPAIDIGDRQAGRDRAISVIHCEPMRASIVAAIDRAMSSEAREIALWTENPYGDGRAADRIVAAIAAALEGGLARERKRFYDLDTSERRD